MNALLTVCCGLDVHKEFVTACLLITGASGQAEKELRVFRTVTSQLHELADWLRSKGCRHAALESTGVYWKPVYNVLEGACEQVLLVNARHVKNLPGRKTDVKDAEWLATLLQHGLLRGSFIPPKDIRELRDLTRYRATLVRQRADECNRIQKLLENGNIKLAGVATDILGKSGRAMLEALAAGKGEPAAMAELALGRMRKKIPELTEALRGFLSEPQRWLLGEQLRRVAELEEATARLDAEVARLSKPYAAQLDALEGVPGFSRRAAEVVLAEVGADMGRFPSAGHLASWAGVCPGHKESGGKRQSGKTRKGNAWLRATLVQSAWAASRTRGSSFRSQYQRVARRRGKKRACLAVGHRLLRVAYLLLKGGGKYEEKGEGYFDSAGKDRLKDQLLRRLRRLGFDVTVAEAAAAAG